MNGLALFYTTTKILNEQNAQIHSTFLRIKIQNFAREQ